MPFEIDKKLVVGVSSNALFDLREADEIFRNEGVEAYRDHQTKNKFTKLEKGTAFPFIKRFLRINNVYTKERPVEVVLLSRNSPDTGVRAFNSVKDYGLDISRACFTTGEPPYRYMPAFNVSLFLSTNEADVKEAIDSHFPAGLMLHTKIEDDEDSELRVAFDFDGVLADDEAEKVYKSTGQIEIFHEHESQNSNIPLKPGILADFFKKLSYFQELETKKKLSDRNYRKILKTSILTARNAPSHERAINTLKSWNVEVDEMILTGGIEKRRFLKIMKPHLFLDDQISHLDTDLRDVPLVHIPFGIANVTPSNKSE
jgi:5'-nucleotidase